MLGQEHWDTCQEAGPNERPFTPFAVAMPSLSLVTCDGHKLQPFGCKVVYHAQFMSSKPTATATMARVT